MTRQTVHPPPHDRAASPAFTATERRLIRRLSSPAQVQRYLNSLPYNTEPPPGGPTLRSFRSVVRTGTAHCLESSSNTGTCRSS